MSPPPNQKQHITSVSFLYIIGTSFPRLPKSKRVEVSLRSRRQGIDVTGDHIDHLDQSINDPIVHDSNAIKSLQLEDTHVVTVTAMAIPPDAQRENLAKGRVNHVQTNHGIGLAYRPISGNR